MTETFPVPDYDAYPVVRALVDARIVDGDVEVRRGVESADPARWPARGYLAPGGPP